MHDQDDQARQEGVNSEMANVGDSNNESGYDDDEPTIGIDSSKYPFLSKAKLTSFKPSELYGLLLRWNSRFSLLVTTFGTHNISICSTPIAKS